MYKLVIADDENRIRNGLCEVLNWEEIGFEIVGAFEDGEDVIEYIKNNSVDVILSDIVMCNIDGLEIAKYIKSNSLNIPIVLISGYQEFEYAKRAIDYDCERYLLKPVSKDVLYNTMLSIKNDLDKNNYNKNMGHIDNSFITVNDLYGELLRTIWNNRTISKAQMQILNLFLDFKHKEDVKLTFFVCKELLYKKTDLKNALKYFVSEGGIYTLVDERDILCMLPVFDGESVQSVVRRHIQKMNKGTQNIAFLDWDMFELLKFNQVGISREEVINAIKCIFEEFIKLDKGNIISEDLIKKLLYLEVCDVDFTEAICKLSAGLFLTKYVNIDSPTLLQKVCLKAINLNSIKDISEWIISVYQCFTTLYNGDKNQKYDFVIAKVKKYISENINEDLSVNRLARLVHLNAAYFGRYFKEHTLYSVNQYVLKVKMEYAIEQMYNNKSLSEVAEMIGYNVKYFFTIFKKYTGYSPKEFKRYYIEVEK